MSTKPAASKALVSPEVFETVQVLRLDYSTDVLVYRSTATLSRAQEEGVREALAETTGLPVERILVIDRGASLSVLQTEPPRRPSFLRRLFRRA